MSCPDDEPGSEGAVRDFAGPADLQVRACPAHRLLLNLLLSTLKTL